MENALLIVFTFGVGIFIFLSMVEAPVWKLIFHNDSSTSEKDVRFVHEALQRLTSKLPASNGVVLVFGFTLMILQGNKNSWNYLSIAQLSVYFILLLIIVALRKNPLTVKAIRSHSSRDGDLVEIQNDLRNVGIDHHLGLVANLFALILQLMIGSI
jgi:hypothetical protein